MRLVWCLRLPPPRLGSKGIRGIQVAPRANGIPPHLPRSRHLLYLVSYLTPEPIFHASPRCFPHILYLEYDVTCFGFILTMSPFISVGTLCMWDATLANSEWGSTLIGFALCGVGAMNVLYGLSGGGQKVTNEYALLSIALI